MLIHSVEHHHGVGTLIKVGMARTCVTLKQNTQSQITNTNQRSSVLWPLEAVSSHWSYNNHKHYHSPGKTCTAHSGFPYDHETVAHNQILFISLFSTVVDCGTLANPANGQVSTTARTTFRQTATYSCNTGYNLVGDSTRTCQATGQWSGSVPTCQRMLQL